MIKHTVSGAIRSRHGSNYSPQLLILRMRYVSVRSLTMPKPSTDRLFTRLAIV